MGDRLMTHHTDILNHPSKKNCLKSHKRFKTEFSQTQKGWFKTQKDIAQKMAEKKKFIRFSGQVTGSQQMRGSKKIETFEDLLAWHKLFITPKSQKTSVMYGDEDNQINILKSHLDSVGRSPRKLHKRSNTQSNFSSTQSKKGRTRTAQIPMDRIKFSKCSDIIEDIYNKISILKEIGYADDKINHWVLVFCDERRPFMKHILMKNINNTVYAFKEQFYYEKEANKVKAKIKYQIRKNRDQFNYIEISQLNQFNLYLEEILIQKNIRKAREVEQSIVQKLSLEMVPKIKNDFCVFTKKQPIAVYNFIQELGNFQQKHGNFYSFSKINKLRFVQLTHVEKRLKVMYKQLLDGEVKKFQSKNSHKKAILKEKTSTKLPVQ